MESKHEKSHIYRRLGHLKANKVLCCVTTLSGNDFDGRVVSFDNESFVLQPHDDNDPTHLITITYKGLESIAVLS